MTENEIAKVVGDAAIEVQRELGGPGLHVAIYEEALAEELRLRSLRVERQFPLWISYKGRVLAEPARLGMKVEGLVLVENRADPDLSASVDAQMLTYLRLTGLKLGLVINFGEPFVKDGIQRVAIGSPDAISFKPQLKRKNPKDGPGWRPS
jgi:GxxExxY protein